MSILVVGQRAQSYHGPTMTTQFFSTTTFAAVLLINSGLAFAQVSKQGMAGISDEKSQKNVVQIAVGSKDHSTLVTAVTTANLTDDLANPGPFTVFAPTNAAFDKLPKGTVEGLLKPAANADLTRILQYHVFVGTLKTGDMKDGDKFDMVDGGMVTIGVKGGKYTVNGANIVASVPASNGIVHVIDGVLLPPAPEKKK